MKDKIIKTNGGQMVVELALKKQLEAAAPDLLAACEAARSSLDRIISERNGCMADIKALKLTESALRKAKGGGDE